jgi:biotin transport system permease protein
MMRSFYLEEQTWLHGLPAWIKLLVLSATGTILFAGNGHVLATVATAVAVAVATLGAATWRTLRSLRGLALVLGLILLFHGITDSWVIGLDAAARLGCLAVLGMLLTLSTPFGELLAVVEAALRPLRVFGLPTERAALAFGLMLRFIEIFFLRWQQLDEACRARSGRRGGFRLLAPLAIQVLATAERVGDALSARLGR